MPIDLPPTLPPQQADIALVQAQAETSITVAAAGVNYQVNGPKGLDTQRLNEDLAAAADASAAVRAVVAVARASGYPAARVLYAAIDSSHVAVLVQPGSISEVIAPEPLKGFFSGLETSTPLTDSALERRRALAGLHADRIGYATQPVLIATGERTVLDLKATDTGTPGGAKLELGNPGTRFTGKVLLDFSANRSDLFGNNYSLLVRESDYLVRQQERGAYHEQSAGVSRAFPLGLVAANLRHVKYRQNLGSDGLNGQIVIGDVSLMAIPYASFNTRVTAQLKADWTRKVADLQSSRATVQREPYPSVELGSQLTRRSQLFGHSLEWDSSLTYRHGLGDNGNKLSLADLHYQLARSALGLRTPIGDELNLSLQAAGQYSNNVLPEQQQWVFGGIGTLHAWYPGALVGDKAWLGRVQLDHSGFAVRSAKLAPVAYAEYAGARLKLGQGTQQLADVGLGLNLTGQKIWSASVAAALPVLEVRGGNVGFHPSRAGVFLRVAGFWS